MAFRKAYFSLPACPNTISIFAFAFSYYERFSLYLYNFRPFVYLMSLEPSIGLLGINLNTSLYCSSPLINPKYSHSLFLTATLLPFSIRYRISLIYIGGMSNFRRIDYNLSIGLTILLSFLSSLKKLVASSLAFGLGKYFWRASTISAYMIID